MFIKVFFIFKKIQFSKAQNNFPTYMLRKYQHFMKLDALVYLKTF